MKKGAIILLFISLLLFNALPVGAVEKEDRKWQDETVYSLMIDRFNNGDQSNDMDVDLDDPIGYHGGDFQGVIDQLDYIKDMGFTAISLTPVFDNIDGGYHGYWVNDYYKTEEHFGSIELFKKLVDEVHKRDMKVILDFVMNPIGPNHPWVNDPTKEDWFYPGQQEVDQEKSLLPKLNQENSEVKQYLIEAAKWWIEETDIDGYRLDSVDEVRGSFLLDFSKEVKSVKSNFYLLGETMTNDPNEIASYKETGIDGFVDYPLNKELRKVFPAPNQSFSSLFMLQEQNKELYSNPYLVATFMDNQHTVRFTRDTVSINEHPGPRWKQALTYLYTTPGIPFVYYGSEIALDGGETPDNHRQMNFRADNDLNEYIAKIGEIRSKLPALTRGTMEMLYEKNGLAAFKRVYKKETVVVVINNTTKTETVTIPAKELAGDKELRGILNGDLVRSSDDAFTITIDRDESEVYVLSNKSGINIPYILALAAVLISFAVFMILVSKKSRRQQT
jgi:glycosidase